MSGCSTSYMAGAVIPPWWNHSTGLQRIAQTTLVMSESSQLIARKLSSGTVFIMYSMYMYVMVVRREGIEAMVHEGVAVKYLRYMTGFGRGDT